MKHKIAYAAEISDKDETDETAEIFYTAQLPGIGKISGTSYIVEKTPKKREKLQYLICTQIAEP